MRYVKVAGRYTKVTDEQLRAMRYIPKNSVAIEEPSIGVVYVAPSSTRTGYYHAVGYKGTAGKSSFNYIFKTDTQLDAYIQKFFEGLKDWKDRVKERRAEHSKPHTLKVGDVITNSWGYDQTNVDWYRIVKTTAHFVWLQEIGSEIEATGFMCGDSTPAIDTSDPDPSKWGFLVGKGKITKHAATGANCHMRFGCGSKWDGRAMGASWGH